MASTIWDLFTALYTLTYKGLKILYCLKRETPYILTILMPANSYTFIQANNNQLNALALFLLVLSMWL